MRKLVAVAALLAGMPVAHAADGKGEFTASAEYRLRYQFDQNKTANESTDTNKNSFNQRVKVGLHFKASEKLAAHVTLLHNAALGNFGDITAGNATTHDSNTSKTDGINNNQNMALVHEAFGTWMLSDSWFFKFGRGQATLADGSVVSANDWEDQPYSFDGFLLVNEQEMFRATLGFVKAIDNAPAGTNNDDPEANFYNLSLDWKSLPEFLKTAHISVQQVNKDRMNFTVDPDGTGNPGKSELRYNLVLAGDVAGIDYKLDYAAHNGESTAAAGKTDLEGSMMAAELGYSMPEMMKSRVHVAYHADTGDSSGASNTKYDSFFTEKHGSAGLMDVLGWGNLTFIKAGYTFSPMDQVNMGLHYWMFERTETTSAATLGNNGAFTNSATGTKSDLGSEVDLMASKKYDNGLTMTAWAGMFMPGGYVKDNNTKDDTYTQIFVEGKMNF